MGSFFPFRRTRNWFAVDVGSSAVKMAEVTGGRGGGQVVRTGTLPVPAGAVENGVVHEIETVGRAMREFAGAERGRSPQAVVSIPGRRAIIKRLQVACRETDDLDRVIEFEAMDAIPEELDNVKLDYHVVGPSENGDGLEVMLVAARNTLVASYVDLMEAAGLAAAVVDVDHFALRSGSAPGPRGNAQGNVRVLVHVGACSTIVHIPAEASPGYTTDLPLGGERFTEELAGRLRLPRDEAEAVKCDAPAGEVAGLLDTLCDEFAARVARSLNLLGPLGDGSHRRQVSLSGGGALLPALGPSLARALDAEVRPAGPFFGGGQAHQDSGRGPAFAVLAGLVKRSPYE